MVLVMPASLSVTFKAAALILLSTAISGNLPEDDFRIINKQDLLASDSSVFEDKSSRSFSQLLFEVAREQVIVGARDAIYRLSLRGLRLIEKADWAAPPDKAQLCQDKGQTEEDCHNFIKILLSYGHKLFVCGTNAFKPLCSWREIESIKSVLEWVTGVEKCFPYNPHANVTAILTTAGAYYTGTSTDFSGSDTAICGDRNVSFSGIATIRTSQYDYKWLYDPQFVGSFEDDNFVYFVFREIALEYMNCGKKIYSRIARICKNDSGGNTMMKNNWNTYLKARLNCSVSGEYPFYYDEVQSIEYLPDRKILAAVFTTPENSITGSAVCFFNMSEVHKAFEGSFKIQEGPTRTWESKAMTEQVKEHFRCGASLSPHQLMEYHQHHLMNDAVQPISAQPIYTTILETFTHVTVDVTPTKTGAQYVVFVATQDSNILKLAVLPEFKGVCLVEIWKLKDYKSQIRVQSLQFVKDTMSVYIGSETGVLRLIAHRCQRHRSRASCLGATDPYCGWDDGRDVCVDAPMHVHEARFVQSSDRCPTVDMPVDGGWSSWSEWEPCVQDNGPGYNGYNEKPDMCMCRHRKCDNPKPANGGENCEGTSTAVSNCTVHGGWSPWSPWSECSATCGIALKSRRRSCTAPEPKYGGRVCVGLDSHELYCSNLPPCPDPNLVPVDGGWSQWGPWTTCTSEGGPICGPNAGWRERRRTCNNPVPKYGGADCDGIKIEKQICDLRPCEIRRVTAWTPWVQIPSNSSDGGYTEKRFKFACKAPSPEQIKLTQVKDEERYCTSQGYCGPVPPPEADGWGEWGEWGACSAACGGGQQRRRRDCLRPPCRGQGTTLRACNTHSCKGEWSCWSDWSECGGECNVDGTSATGHRTRTRMCLSPEGCDDAGAALERRVCVNTCDDTDTGWSDWGEWGACIAEERVRKRSCVRGACIGPLVQVALCEDEIDNSLNAMPAYSQGIETASFVTLRDNNSMSVGAIVGCVVTAFVMGFFVCFIGFIYCSRRKNSQLPWRRKTKVPSSPHYITAKQNSYVTVPLKDVPRKAKRQPSFTGISSSTSGIILSKSNNLSTNPNNHNNAVTTPKLYPKAIANEYDNMGTLRRHSNQPNHKSNINLEEEKFY